MPLKHVIVIEEAHNIVGQSSPQSGGEGQSSSKAFAAEYVTRMLAELRALGEGIAIIDQLPTAVSPEVIKNTGTKLALRQVSEDDREILAATMLLDGQQAQELARLRVGEGFFYNEKLHSPRRARCLNAHGYLNLSAEMYPDSKVITGILYQDEWFQQVLRDQIVYISHLYKTFSKGIEKVSVRAQAILGKVCKSEELAEISRETGLQKVLLGYSETIFSFLEDIEKEFNSIEKQHTEIALRVDDWGEDLAKQMLELLNKEFEEYTIDQLDETIGLCQETLEQIELKQVI